ncbi:unnamed protein product, partial [Mycena citricolor]
FSLRPVLPATSTETANAEHVQDGELTAGSRTNGSKYNRGHTIGGGWASSQVMKVTLRAMVHSGTQRQFRRRYVFCSGT